MSRRIGELYIIKMYFEVLLVIGLFKVPFVLLILTAMSPINLFIVIPMK